MNRHIVAAICCLLMLLISPVVYAISTQWDLDPISGDWNTADNWTPMGVPNGPADIATFGLSHTTNVSISANTEVNSIIFTPAATNPYTITASAGLTLTISGLGVTNTSAIGQSFVTAVSPTGAGGQIVFTNNASAGTSTTFTNNAGIVSGIGDGETLFLNASTAASGTFINNGGTSSGERAGRTLFAGSSTAANGTFINNGGTNGALGGITAFSDSSSAGNGVFINKIAASAGIIYFFGSSTADHGIFTNDQAGDIFFLGNSTAANGTFINNGARGGFIEFFGSSTAGNGVFTNNFGDMSFSDNSTAGDGVFTNNGFGSIIFSGNSTAANGTFTNNGATLPTFTGSVTLFGSNSTAANGTFINNGGTVSGAGGGSTEFFDSTAANGTFINNGGTASGAGGGSTMFFGSSTAANSSVTNNGSTVSVAGGGSTEFFDNSTAANATITNNGGMVSGAGGGKTIFHESSTAGSATLIANSGASGGEGGQIFFENRSTGGTSRVELFGNGSLDVSARAGGVTIGSIEGDGTAFLGANDLKVGSNNLSTTFSGVIQDGGAGGGTGGSFTKVGSGTLILSGANTYTGNTNVSSGVLKIDGSITSNTFIRQIRQRGILAGTGTINGNVTNGGSVSPGDPLGVPGVLTVVHTYTQAQYASLMIQIAGANAGQFSVLNVLGNANIGPNGLLDPVLLNGFIPTVGEQFVFMNYSSLVGSFFIFNPNIDSVAEHWVVSYQARNAILSVAAGNVPVPDQGSTFLLLMLGLLGLVTYRRQLLPKQS